MKKVKLLGFLMMPIVASSLLVATTVNAQTNDGQNDSSSTSTQGYGYGRMMRRRIMIPMVAGTVSSISGNIITVTGKNGTSYTVDGTNAVVIKNNVKSSISNIAVGDTLSARGALNGTSLTATYILDGNWAMKGAPIIQGNGQPVIAGNVTVVSGSTLTVTNRSNVVYTVDTTNAKFTKRGVVSSLPNISVGDRVVVQGTVNGTSVTASSVMDQGVIANSPMMNPSGTSQNVRPGFMGMMSGFFHNMFGF